MEQEKIDVTRATPVTPGTSTRATRRGAPMWLQILLSLIVIVVAVGIFALYNSTANEMVKRVGIALPLLNAPAEAQTQTAAAPAGQGQGGQRPGQGGAAGGRPGGFGGGGRSAIVVTQPVKSGVINNQLSAIGESSALHWVTVSSASGGTLLSVDVKPGDHVQAGARLATLDSDTQQNALDKARLAAQDAQASLARAKTLAASNSLPQTQLDAAQLAADTARLAVQAAQIALDQRTITTPVAGTVGLIQVTAGNLINAQTVITTVEDSSEILINFWVPERYSSQMKVGAAVNATSAALPGKTFAGTISAVDNKIDPASRTLQVQATLPNSDGVIKSGMSFTVDMTFPGQTFAAVDPLSVQWSNTGAYVWKVVNDKAVKGMVEIVQRNSDGVLVTGDVKPGDAVVTQGVLQLSDNMAVRLLDQAAPAGGGRQGQGASGAPAASATAPAGN
ncbi:MAG TPA: efflux RND transporter periplasmic adaptor subunit [Devosia sp.]|nr:efflux RND transporter periplasmic adaptor subunit [Devosia sp.]